MTRNEISERKQQNLLRQEYLKLCKPTLPPMNFLINKVRYEHIVTIGDRDWGEYASDVIGLKVYGHIHRGYK